MMQLRPFQRSLLLTTAITASNLMGCGDSSKNSGSNEAGATNGAGVTSSSSSGSGTGGASGTTGSFSDGAGLNQCGVAAPAPADTGQCSTVSAPLITDFDDYAGDDAESYTFYVNSAPPAEDAVLGAILHVGDGSDTDADSVIATEMVAGATDAGHALRFSNSNAVNWGGLLMLYFPNATTACLDASAHAGIEFSIQGSTPSGRVGVNLGMLDTIPTAEDGLCNNATASDCKDPTLGVTLPSDSEEWRRIRVPWSAFTPGIGSDTLCVPNTGENIVRLVIQPFMNYAPPDYAFEPGAYSLSVDDIRFYGTRNTSGDGVSGAGGDCAFPESIEWSASAPIITPVSDAAHDLVAVKDPSVVRFNDRWHVYASSVSTMGEYNLVYTSFTDFSQASEAPLYYVDRTPGFDTYVAAPQVFYFTPQDRWYLVFQSGPPMYSTTDNVGDPTTWSVPQPFYAATPAIISESGGGWLDYWVICESETCHLFFSSNQGRFYKSKTSKSDFPNGFDDPVVVMEDSNSGRIFEGSNVYKMNGTNQFLTIIEAFDQTSNDHRYFRSWLADSLEGPWLPWQASGSYPFAGPCNVTFEETAWTEDISHGEMIRAGYDETLAIDPCDMQYIFQGADPTADNDGDYNKIPWNLGLLSQVP